MNAFSRTLRSIAADEARPRAPLLALAMAPLVAWIAWAVLADVAVRESSASARLEVVAAPHRVQAPVTGIVVAVHLELDRAVAAGDVLVELDARLERLKLEEQTKALASLEAQRARAEAERVATEGVLRADARTVVAAAEEARALARGAEAQAGLSRVEKERFDQLYQKQGLAELEVRRVDATRVERESAASSAVAGAARVEAETQSRAGDARARAERLMREIAALDGDIAVARTAIVRLEEEIGRRVIRAPVAGRLGSAATIRPGAMLQQGADVAHVVPDGGLRVVARFPVATAVGRIRAGQIARVRLDSFPFTTWGTLRATVRGVATESEDQLVVVELDVDRDPTSTIPLQHGLTGVVDVEVERSSPAALVLRLAGRAMTRPRA